MILNFLIALLNSFLHVGSIKPALILCLVAGAVYFIQERMERLN